MHHFRINEFFLVKSVKSATWFSDVYVIYLPGFTTHRKGREGSIGGYRGIPVAIQCTSDIVATLGQHFLATISDWPLYLT